MNPQLELIAQTLLRLADTYKPKEAALLSELFLVAKELSVLLKDIRSQTEEESPEVWEKVREDFADSLQAFNDAVEK